MAFMTDKQVEVFLIHTYTITLDDLPEALCHARERVDNTIKIVVKARGVEQQLEIVQA